MKRILLYTIAPSLCLAGCFAPEAEFAAANGETPADDDAPSTSPDAGSESAPGADAGGADDGETDAGDSETGGDETGGDENGGDETGGDATGGDETGGDATGGDETGGDDTGGDETGGDETGGGETSGETGTVETAICGDGTIDEGEICDDGTNDGSYNGCASDCLAMGPFCGDGSTDAAAGETCDDADSVQGNGCNNDCRESGRELWGHAYDAGFINEIGRDVDVGPDGTILAMGELSDPSSNRRTWLSWYSSDGAQLDTRVELNGNSAQQAELLGGGDYVIAWGEGSQDALRAYDDAHTEIWSYSPYMFSVGAISVDDAGATYFVGNTNFGPVYGKIGSNGVVAWADSTATCSRVSALGSDGAILRCGNNLRRVHDLGPTVWETPGSPSTLDGRADGTFATLGFNLTAYDADGVPQWVTAGAGSNYVAADADGNVVAVDQELLSKFASDGSALWTQDYTTGRLFAADVTLNGSTVVAGWDYDGAIETDIVVRKYAP